MVRSHNQEGKENMKDKLCAICGGKIANRKVTLDRIVENKFYLFEKVSADVCQQCGEIWIPGRTAEWMDEAIQNHIKPKKKIAVPVY